MVPLSAKPEIKIMWHIFSHTSLDITTLTSERNTVHVNIYGKFLKQIAARLSFCFLKDCYCMNPGKMEFLDPSWNACTPTDVVLSSRLNILAYLSSAVFFISIFYIRMIQFNWRSQPKNETEPTGTCLWRRVSPTTPLIIYHPLLTAFHV